MSPTKLAVIALAAACLATTPTSGQVSSIVFDFACQAAKDGNY